MLRVKLKSIATTIKNAYNTVAQPVKNTFNSIKSNIVENFKVAGIAAQMTAGIMKTSFKFAGEVVKAVASEIGSKFKNTFSSVATSVKENFRVIRIAAKMNADVMKTAFKFAGEVVKAISSEIGSKFKNTFNSVAANIKENFRVFGIAAKMSADVMKTAFKFAGQVIGAVAKEIGSRFKDSFTKSFKEIASSPQMTALKNIFYGIRNTFKGAWDEISSTPAFNIALSKISKFAKKIKDAFKNINGGPGAGGTGVVGLGNKLKTVVTNSKLAESAIKRVKTAMNSAFGPTSPIGVGFGKFTTHIQNFITKLKEATGVFKKFFGATKNFETASYASGINQALDQVAGGGKIMGAARKIGRITGTVAKIGAKVLGGGGGVYGGLVLGASQALNGDYGSNPVTAAGDIAMTVGGAVTMFAPEIGVPIMVGAAIVTSIGKAMDSAAEASKQLAIKSAVVNIANQTNSSQAVANLQEALGVSAAESVRIVNKYNSGGSGYAGLISGAKKLTGTEFMNSGQGRDFVSALQAAISGDTGLLTAIKTNRALYPVILKLGVALQQENQGAYKINTSANAADSATKIATRLSNLIAEDPTLAKLQSSINGIIVTNAGLDKTTLNKTQAAIFQTILSKSASYQALRSAASTSSQESDQFNGLQTYQNAQYGLAKDISSGAYQSSTQEYQRLIMAGYGPKEKLYQRDPRDGSIDYSKALPLKDFIALLKNEGIKTSNLDNPKKAPQIIIPSNALATEKTLFNNINAALMMAWKNK